MPDSRRPVLLPGEGFHPDLRHQLRGAGLPEDPGSIPEGPWRSLLRKVDRTYREAAAHRPGRHDAAGEGRNWPDFIARLSHEVRTPLNGALGMIQLLLATDLSRHQRQMAVVALESSRALLGVLNDALDFARLESGQAALVEEPFSPVGLFREAVSLLRARHPGREVALETCLGPGLPEVALGDATRIRRVLLEVFSLAMASADAGGLELTLSTASDAASGRFLLCEARFPGKAVPEAAGLFLPFQGAEPGRFRAAGAGLSLHLTRESVGRMGGRLGCDSQAGEAGRFWVTLPLRVPGEAMDAPGGKEDGQTMGGIPAAEGHPGVRILLVEDNLVNQRVFESMLEHLGYACTKAGNGQEALVAMAARDYDLVFMDCQMPVMDGYEAVHRARSGNPSQACTIIAMTAHALEGDREKCLRAGMDDYLPKPVSLESLSAMLEKWLGVRRLRAGS